MRVMLDTNIFISAIFFPTASTWHFLSVLSNNATIVLCDYIITEIRRINQKKFANKNIDFDAFLLNLPHEMVSTSFAETIEEMPKIRDPKDSPILATAIAENVDVLVSGDKDFLVLDIPKPRIMNMSDFINEYEKGTCS
ncbi:MAG: putative toxin-antitoxin system toxin component, PIN family [Selenomonas sp.]|nr:putative toxin-antitoxin system toxin component, PIN family [Selenomonas sp.]